MIGSRRFDLIVATDRLGGIGLNNSLPWRIQSDIAFFKKMTSTCPAGMYNAVIMGRNTYFSLPPNHRPLKNRLNIILSRQRLNPESVNHQAVLPSLEAALARLSIETAVHRIFVIGGQATYETAVDHHKLDTIYRTYINHTFNCDTRFPGIPTGFRLTQSSGAILCKEGYAITIEAWRRR